MLSSDFYIKYHTDLTFLYPNAIKYQHIRKRSEQGTGSGVNRGQAPFTGWCCRERQPVPSVHQHFVRKRTVL